MVDVDAVESGLGVVVVGEGFEVWGEGSAGSAPCGAEVDYGDAWGVDGGCEGVVG